MTTEEYNRGILYLIEKRWLCGEGVRWFRCFTIKPPPFDYLAWQERLLSNPILSCEEFLDKETGLYFTKFKYQDGTEDIQLSLRHLSGSSAGEPAALKKLISL